jgi:hypothetical protein
MRFEIWNTTCYFLRVLGTRTKSSSELDELAGKKLSATGRNIWVGFAFPCTLIYKDPFPIQSLHLNGNCGGKSVWIWVLITKTNTSSTSQCPRLRTGWTRCGGDEVDRTRVGGGDDSGRHGVGGRCGHSGGWSDWNLGRVGQSTRERG